jgi:glycosyltransferase involved in cell wall biosynthesis
MPKLVLNFICKDESHVIERMLNSSKSITDLIVAVDTGSTDNTIELIKRFGENNNIPTYVFQRPFDTFNNSRNYAMQKAKDVVSELDWNSNETWTYWFDCDEQMLVDSNFDKNQFNKDLFMINARIGKMVYTRNTFCRVSKLVDELEWIGPVHEFITSKSQNITSGLAQNLMIDVFMDGASWKGDISQKYLSHAHKLEAYIAADRKDPRWIFYTAQSYHDSASMKDNKEENEERLRRSLRYYRERVNRTDGYVEEIYYSQYRIGTIMRMLEDPWNLTHQELLKAYSMDPLRGESIKVIIDYYLQIGDWNMAYLYSKFAKSNFHGKNPYPTRLLFVDEAIYVWKFLESHAATSYYCGKIDEAIATYNEILQVTKTHPQYFTEQDLQKIQANGQFFKKR